MSATLELYVCQPGRAVFLDTVLFSRQFYRHFYKIQSTISILPCYLLRTQISFPGFLLQVNLEYSCSQQIVVSDSKVIHLSQWFQSLHFGLVTFSLFLHSSSWVRSCQEQLTLFLLHHYLCNLILRLQSELVFRVAHNLNLTLPSYLLHSVHRLTPTSESLSSA